MKTPGLRAIQNIFSACFIAAHTDVPLNGSPLRIIAAALLLAAAILPANASPQANANYPSNGGATQLPAWQSTDRMGGGAEPGTLLGTLSATPSSVNFGSVAVGLTNSQSISLTNTGSANVQISRASVAGAGFKVSGLSASTIISPGQSVTFNVSFRPSAASALSATASIYSNASNSPLQISMSGTGTASNVSLGVSPSSLSFGNVTVGASNTLDLTLTNSGNVSITIYKVNVPSSVFTTSGVPNGLILAPSQTAALAVTYAPTSVSTASGSISISSSATTSPIKISVTGSGVQPAALSVSLGWQASVSPGVAGYYVYRGTISGGPYSVLNSSPDSSTQYADQTVQAGATYYYVVTSVDSGNMQSGFSVQVKAVIPAQ